MRDPLKIIYQLPTCMSVNVESADNSFIVGRLCQYAKENYFVTYAA